MSIFKDEWDDWRMGWELSLIIGCILLAVFVLLLVLRQVDYHYSSTYCQPKLRQVNRQGKFVQYNFWDYDCLVKSKDGTYIPLENLYNNVQENNVQGNN